jgi:dihydrofolate reductase
VIAIGFGWALETRSVRSMVSLGTRKSFLVLFFKKEQKKKNFFLKKEAKTFFCWARAGRPARAGGLAGCLGWGGKGMATVIFGLQQSLDGYVDHMALGPPGARVFRHFVEHVRGLAGCLYGRRTYEIMRYWDDDQAAWDAQDRDFAEAWRSRPKWVVSRSLASVGPNATLVRDDLGTAVRALKARLEGEIDVAGPELAGCLTDLGLVDAYRLYFRPVVLGQGTKFFAGKRPPLRLVANDLVGEEMVRLTYVPA